MMLGVAQSGFEKNVSYQTSGNLTGKENSPVEQTGGIREEMQRKRLTGGNERR
jgi:hypothetical protein